jgi:hypothetical protein
MSTIPLRQIAAVAIVLAAADCTSSLPPVSGGDAERAVADFYQWYVPLARGGPDAEARALRERAGSFSPALVKALGADAAASAKSPDEVVGLDGDPFLNAQDFCDRYDTIGTTQKDARFLVGVRGSGGCAAHTTADVTVEVTPIDGRPLFTNFIYSPSARDNLVERLADLAAERR